MVNKTLGDEIVIMVDDRISRLPVNRVGIINKIYTDNFIDINLDNEILNYVKCFGNPQLEDNCIVFFINNDFNNPIAICEDIGGGGGDTPELKDYVKKKDLIDKTKYDVDLNIQFGASGIDDMIIIDMDIVDHKVSKTINIGG